MSFENFYIYGITSLLMQYETNYKFDFHLCNFYHQLMENSSMHRVNIKLAGIN